MPPKPTLQVDFNDSVRPDEKPEIIVRVEQAWQIYDAFKSSNQATVYVAGAGGPNDKKRWWHKTRTDPKIHVTVRYNRRVGGYRAHVYEDGSANISPHKPQSMSADGSPDSENSDDELLEDTEEEAKQE